MKRVLAVTLLGFLVLAGCGGAGEVSADDKSTVSDAEFHFTMTVIDGSSYGKTLRGVDDLIEICRKEPAATVDDGRTMRQIVEDGSNTLRQYQPDLAAQLEQVADNGCE